MMALTYEPIATFTQTSENTAFVFNSIPQTYTDLRAVLISKGGGGNDPHLRYNNDTSSVYYTQGINTLGTTPVAYQFSVNTGRINPGGLYHDTLREIVWIMDIFDYTSTDHKMSLHRLHAEYEGGSNGTANAIQAYTGTGVAVTSIQLYAGNTWSAGGIATLYGIKKA